jgi:hypothetical protein
VPIIASSTWGPNERVACHHLVTDTLAHLGCGGFGEGDGDDLRDLAAVEEPHVALDEDVRLAAAGASCHGDIDVARLDDRLLLWR